MNKFTKSILTSFVCLYFNFSQAQISITSSGGTSTSASYTTVDSAIRAINGALLHTGTITVNINAGHTETLTRKIILSATGTLANPITIQKNGAGTNPLLTAYVSGTSTPTSANQDGIFTLRGCDFVTIDGINLIENTSNSGSSLMEYGYGLFKVSALNGCQNNVIRNCRVTLSRENFASGIYPMGFGSTAIGQFASTDSFATTIIAAGSLAGGNSNNSYHNNIVEQCHQGIFLAGGNEIAPFTFADRGNDIGGSASATGNLVINFGGGISSNTLSSGIRTAFQYNLNVRFNTINNNNGGGANHPNVIRGILIAVANNANTTISNNTIILKAASAAFQTAAIESGAGSLGAGNRTLISNNIIRDCEVGALSTGFLGIFSVGGPSKLEIRNNQIRNFTSAATAGLCYTIWNQGSVDDSIIMDNNLIDSFYFTANTSAAFFGVANNGPGVGTSGTSENNTTEITNNTYRRIYYTGPTGGTGVHYFCYNADTAAKFKMSNNIIDSVTLFNSGSTYMFFNSFNTSAANATREMNSNRIQNYFTRSKASVSLLWGVSDQGTQLGSSTFEMSNNDLKNITTDTTLANSFTGYTTSGGFVGPYAKKTVSNNNLSRVLSGNSTFTGMLINAFGGADTSRIFNNTFFNLKGRSSLTVLNIGTSAENGNIFNNRIDSITSSGFVTGINAGGGSLNSTTNFYNNLVTRIYKYSTSNVYGILTTTGQNINIYNNVLSDFTNPFTTSVLAVSGIFVSTGINVNVFNNTIIFGKSAPLGTTGTSFGVSGIYYPNSLTTLLNAVNNIIWLNVNSLAAPSACVQRASGTANTVPLNFRGNNNIYYINPNANNWLYVEGTSNLTNNNGWATSTITAVPLRNLAIDLSFNSPCGLYKRFMTTRGEGATLTEDNMVSIGGAGVWRPALTTASAAESSAQVLPILNNRDYSNANRNSAFPDRGAIEFSGIISDLTPPLITLTPIVSPYYCTTAPIINATITDASGINTSAGTAPRLYYKKSTETDSFGIYPADNIASFNGWKFVEASGTAPNFTFTPNYSLLNSTLLASQTLQYFVIAQDLAPTANVSFNTVGFPAGVCPTSVNLGSTFGPTTVLPSKNSFLRDSFVNIAPKAVIDKKVLCFSDSITLTQNINVANLNYQWQLDTSSTFTNIVGAVNVPFRTFSDKNTRYRLQYFCGLNLLGSSVPDTLIANKPVLTSVMNDTICGDGNAKLRATIANGANNVAWFSSPSSSARLDTGLLFTSPLISATTDYYAAATNLFSSSGTIGNGTTVNSGVGTSPFTTGWEGSRIQYLYTAADFAAIGFTGSRINSISFDITATTGFYLKNYTIKIGHTALTAMSTVVAIPNTTVFGPDSFPVTLAGWRKFNFTTPFLWNGTSNIIVEVCHDNDPTGTGGWLFAGVGSVRVTPTPAIMTVGRYADNILMCGTQNGTLQTLSSRPNIQLDFDRLCESPRQLVRAIVKVAPLANFTISDTLICQGDRINLTGTSANSNYKFGWLPANDTGAMVSYLPNMTTNYTLIAVDSSNGPSKGCKQQISKNVVVRPNVPAIVVTKSKDSICNRGDTLSLLSTLSSVSNQLIYSENFNGTAPGWTNSNASTGGNSAFAAWKLRNSPTRGISSNDASQFYITDSDTQGSGGTTRTFLVSPKINLTNNSSAFLRYFTFYNALSDSGVVEASTDSINWNFLKSYTATTGTATNFFNDSVSINAYSGQSQVWFRFRYRSAWAWHWSLDNVSIVGVGTFAPTWSPITGLFTNAATSVAYASTATTSLFARPLISTNYVARVENNNGCFRTDTAKIFVAQPLAIITIPAATAVCRGSKFTMNVKANNARSYQWLLNGNPIIGATDTLYVINNASLADSGIYRVLIKGTMPCADSLLPGVLIDVKGAQVNITAQPMASTVCENQLTSPISLSVSALNVSNYQWRKNGVNISGANSAMFSIANPSITDSGNYSVRVIGFAPCGDSFSSVVRVNVTPKIIIQTQPRDSLICNIGNVTYSVIASNAFGYQWRRNGTAITGANLPSYTRIGATIADTGNYDVVITGNSPCNTLTSAVARLNVSSLIVISKQPKDTAVCVSSGQTFSVIASNVLSYQWRKAGINITGANGSSYLITNVSSADTGIYDVVLTARAPCPPVTSAQSRLQTVGTVIINSQPVAQTRCVGNNATFSISATNAGGYRWRKNGNNITGATLSSYTINNIALSDSGNYDVVLSDTSSCGNIFSAVVRLAINPSPVISTQPTNQVLCADDNLTLAVTASNFANFQWRKAGVNIVGANSATYTVNPVPVSASGLYDVVVNPLSACVSITSNSVSVVISPKPAIIVQPVAQIVCAGGNTSFSVTANNATGYQWRRNGINITGASAATYTITGATVALAGNIDVVVTGNSPCAAAVSNTVAFTVNTTATINTHPAAQTLCEGSTLSLSVNASNPTGYQWRRNGVDILGATFASYAIGTTIAANAGNYTVVVRSAASCLDVTSNIAVVTINRSIQFTSQPIAQTLCVGNSMTLSAAANNQAGYQWFQGNTQIVGATSPTYIVAAVTGANSGTHRVLVTALTPCADSFSATVMVTINNPLVVTTHPISQTICEGSNVSFSSAVSFATVYQWRRNGINIVGANNANYTITAATTANIGSYDVFATGLSPCTAITTNTATLSVNKPVVISSQPQATTVCVGSPISFSVTANNATAYQWRKVNINILGANSASYTINSAVVGDAAGYSVEVTGIAPCIALISTTANAIVNLPVSGIVNPVTQTVCRGANVVLSAGANNAQLIQWRRNGTNISGANANTLLLNNIDVPNAGNYDVVFTPTAPCIAITTAAAAVTVNLPATITTQPIGATVCEGNTLNLSVSATNATGYQWRRNGTVIAGAGNASLAITNITSALAGNYDVLVNGTSPCIATASNIAQIIINPAVVINAQPVAITSLCLGSPLSLSVTSANAANYQWRKNGVNISGANSMNYVVSATALADIGSYSVAVGGNAPCAAVISNNGLVNVSTKTGISDQPVGGTICEGTTLTMSVIASDAVSFQWYQNTVAIAGAASSSYIVNNVGTNASGDYYVMVNSSAPCAAENSSVVQLLVNPKPVLISSPINRTICVGGTLNLSLNAANNGGYLWRKDGQAIAGATQTNFSITAMTLADQGVYDVIINGLPTCSNINSSAAFVTAKIAAAIISQSPGIVAVKQQKSFTLFATATNASSYQWRKNGTNIIGAIGASYSIGWVTSADFADYDVLVKGEDSCGAINSAIIKVIQDNGTTSIANITKQKSFTIENIYPNPTSGNANMQISTERALDASIIVYNALGQIIERTHLSLQSGSNDYIINTTGFAAGKYMVQVLADGKMATKYLVYILD